MSQICTLLKVDKVWRFYSSIIYVIHGISYIHEEDYSHVHTVTRFKYISYVNSLGQNSFILKYVLSYEILTLLLL